MSLYDLEIEKEAQINIPKGLKGWSQNYKLLLPTNLTVKKTFVSHAYNDNITLPPILTINSFESEENKSPLLDHLSIYPRIDNWGYTDEYNPLNPNNYEKMSKELMEIREREYEEKRKNRKRKKRNIVMSQNLKSDNDQSLSFMSQINVLQPVSVQSNFQTADCNRITKSRWESNTVVDHISKEIDFVEPVPNRKGVEIAPPPCIIKEQNSNPVGTLSGISYGLTDHNSVAAKIMAKYGFKEGQGLGKDDQGMSRALRVERVSDKCARIIDDSQSKLIVETIENQNAAAIDNDDSDLSITEIMKNPSKVIILRNMVAAGEVDDELEPEIKEECQSKYGEVIKVIMFERDDVVAEEAVRVFVEFKKVESAIKAIIDLNGRYFGGKLIKANFYDMRKYEDFSFCD